MDRCFVFFLLFLLYACMYVDPVVEFQCPWQSLSTFFFSLVCLYVCMYGWMFLPACMTFVLHSCLALAESRRGDQMPWDWSYSQLLSAV